MIDRPRVLVVDDDRELCESLADALTDAGYDAVTAGDGAGAMALSHEARPPQLILLDLMMPDMNGWEFREQQLRDPSVKDIPVVVMTASRDLRRHRVDADAFLFKPFTLADLLQQVRHRSYLRPLSDHGAVRRRPDRTVGRRPSVVCVNRL